MASHPAISTSDRLTLTLLLALALHAVIILGIGFVPLPEASLSPRSLEVILVHSHSDTPPEEADYLAQANQQGGGNVEEKVRPSSPFPNPRPTENQGDAQQTQQAAAPPPEATTPQAVLSAEARSRPAPTESTDALPDLEVPPADTLLQQSLEIARLSAEIRQNQQAHAQQPRREYVTANTREHVTAAYEEGWRQKVERVGNLNYPDEAKRRNLSGVLVMEVAIRTDGTLHDVRILRSSGEQVLDDGALRIVQLAAPYAPFPPELKERTDILHIIRAWHFESDDSLRTTRR